MLKLIRRIFLILAIITVFTICGALVYTNGRTFLNDDSEVGNTIGNIYNGGLFCEQEDRIYFSNDIDDGSLYVMNSDLTNIKKVHQDKAVFINADDNYVYYVRSNNTWENKRDSLMMFNNSGVYRINQNGTGLKAFTGNPSSYLVLFGNNVFFQRYDVNMGSYLYKYQIDTKLDRLLLKDAVIPIALINDTLLFNGYASDHHIHKLSLKSFTSHVMFEGNYSQPIYIDDLIYYINLDENNNIYCMKSDGTEPIPVIKEHVSTYNITKDGKYLIYQVDAGKKSRICRYNLDTLTDETVKKGDYKQIHVTDSYVFFKDTDNTNTYLFDTKGAVTVRKFDPSIEEEEVK
jgi:hypothetical protein